MSFKILIVGAGSVGGYFGGRLAEAGRDVTFLARGARAEQLRRDGLRISSPHGDLAIRPEVVEADAVGGPYDLVILSVKGFALEGALDGMAPAVGPGTTILPVLNGMRHVDCLVERFGRKAVIGGVCVVATEIDPDGRVVQLADVQKLAYGELDGTATARIRDVDGELRGAGFEASLSPDIVAAMWEKWVMLASLGAACCLLRGAIGEIAAVRGGTETACAILAECSAAAIALGHPPSPAFLERHRAALTASGSPLTSSMYRDLRKSAPVEAETILGDLVNRAREAGVPTPLLQAAFVNASVYAGREAIQAGS